MQDNVTVFTGSGLEQVTAKGIIDPDGEEHEVDVIILATGFNTSWVPRFPIIADGLNLQDLYRDKPIGYLGVAAPRMPNYFTFYGAYTDGQRGDLIHVVSTCSLTWARPSFFVSDTC